MRYLLIISLILHVLGAFAQPGTYLDLRDSTVYKTITFDNGQTWFAQNLQFVTDSGTMCYDDLPANCEKYGRLYTWEAALTACPEGWHLPEYSEYIELVNLFGNTLDAYLALCKGCPANFNATNSGYYDGENELFKEMDRVGYYWTAKEYTAENYSGAMYMIFNSLNSKIFSFYLRAPNAFYARCILNSEELETE